MKKKEEEGALVLKSNDPEFHEKLKETLIGNGEQRQAGMPVLPEGVESPVAGATEVIQFIGLEQLRESKVNPRKHYEEKGLKDLAESIKAKGVVQNLVVRVLTDELPHPPIYEIVAGSRRFRAAKIAGHEAVPCVVRDYSDAEVLEIMVIENNQREDVHPLEEGEGYAALLKVEGYTVEAIAGKIGRSDKYVRERLQLAQLIPEAKKYLESGNLFYTHGRLLSRLTKEQQEDAMRSIWSGGFYGRDEKHPISVKELETWIEQHVEKSLGSASFPLDDITINKDAGACIGCQFNTASDMQLFPDYTSSKKGICLKPECFKQKVKTYADRILKQKLEDETKADVLLVSRRSYGNVLKKMKDGTERVVVGFDNFEKVKKGEKGAHEAILIGAQDMEDKGKTIYVKLKNKKDAKPSKSDTRQSGNMNTGSTEKALTPEEKAERDRREARDEYLTDTKMVLVCETVMQNYKKVDNSLLYDFARQELENGGMTMEAFVSGVDLVKFENMGFAGRKEAVTAGLKKLNNDQILIACALSNEAEWKTYDQVAKNFNVGLKEIEKEAEERAEKQFPDPAKQLVVTLEGLPWKLKESDHLKDLKVISDSLRSIDGYNDKGVNKLMLIVSAGRFVWFRLNKKRGKYMFSTWPDENGKDMGFERLGKSDFLKLLSYLGTGKKIEWEASGTKAKKGAPTPLSTEKKKRGRPRKAVKGS